MKNRLILHRLDSSLQVGIDFSVDLRYNIYVSHRRTVHRSVGDRKQMLAGRLSDKMSSELGLRFLRCRVFLFSGGFYEKHKG